MKHIYNFESIVIIIGMLMILFLLSPFLVGFTTSMVYGNSKSASFLFGLSFTLVINSLLIINQLIHKHNDDKATTPASVEHPEVQKEIIKAITPITEHPSEKSTEYDD
jgi:hypothetical protein